MAEINSQHHLTNLSYYGNSHGRQTRRFFATVTKRLASTHSTYQRRDGQAKWARVAGKIPG